MIQVAKFTGNVEEGYIEVSLPQNEVLLARPVMASPFISRISKKWLDKYKDDYLAIIDYANDNARYPLLVGIAHNEKNRLPVDDADQHIILTEKFRIVVNDTDNKIIIDAMNDGDILMGNENVSEPAVLGDKNEAALKTLTDAIVSVIDAFTNATVTPQDGGATFKAALMALTTQVKIDLLTFKATDIPQTKSQKIKLK